MSKKTKVFIERIDQYDPDKLYSFVKRTLGPVLDANPDKKTILLKPNLLGRFPVEKAVTTHPLVMDAVARLLHEKGREIWIGDSSGGTVSSDFVYKGTGVSEVVEKYGAKAVSFEKSGAVKRSVRFPDGSTYELIFSKVWFDADAVINLCKLKTHSLMRYTGAVKNLYGVIPGLKKVDFHREFPKPPQFGKLLTEIYQQLKGKILFNVMDGILGMEGTGPSSGKPRKFNTMFASESAPALDKIALEAMGFKLKQIDYVNKALERDGLSPEMIIPEIEQLNYGKVDIQSVLWRSRFLGSLPGDVRKILRKIIDYYPAYKTNCKLCGICVESCPVKAITLPKGAGLPVIDRNKCIKCLCCHEFCPHEAMEIKGTFIANLILRREK